MRIPIHVIAVGAMAAAAVAASAVSPHAKPEGAMPGVESAAALMPPRVLVACPHGFVARSGSGYEFSFNGAPLPEVAEAVGRMFSAAIELPIPDSAKFTGRFTALGPAEALARIADQTGLRIRQDGPVWILGADTSEGPRELGLADLAGAARQAP